MGFDNVPTLSGLFHIVSTKDEKCGYLETVLSWNHFWGNALQQPSFTPFSYNSSNVFEYLEMFEVNDPKLYSHCKNNNMDLKLWEKKENSFKELLNIPIQLRPFFDTFGNPKNASQFYKGKMPVVSLTDWIEVNIGSIMSAKIQVALAIGTVDQLNAFKSSRNITINPCTTSRSDNPTAKKANQTALADMLNTFIDNLALSLPKRVSESTDQRQQYSTDPRYQLRRTSDLLDVLHNALKNPTPSLITSSSALPFKVNGRATNLPTNNVQPKGIKENVRVTVKIDRARNLIAKDNTHDSLDDESTEDNRPCTYVSFEAIEFDNGEQYSTFATRIAQNSCNPHWNEKFNVMLPKDLLQKETDKKLVLKIWRKISSNSMMSHGSQHTDQDEMIGVTAIDLSPLSSESTIAGYFNMVDAAGHVNGELKIHIVPTDDTDCVENSNTSTDDTSELPNTLKDLETGSYHLDNVVLSRTLKRKFTELEEISERLKSRLLDVTAADESFDVDDEFENDLNTCPDEDDVDDSGEFDWNRFSTLEIDCGTSEPVTETVDRGDVLTNVFERSTRNNVLGDENPSVNVQTHE
ncbi:uncharacterized protein LOC119071860 [Bradysia coprophila]|uniref:uncharacterized protein LOC119071860 n=1 Tax=Bradysia coprophila TaxID=38358 RepID=UPI00187D71EE|nr:uncharacterized protein LOC119071860 [Bradysia coprophila]